MCGYCDSAPAKLIRARDVAHPSARGAQNPCKASSLAAIPLGLLDDSAPKTPSEIASVVEVVIMFALKAAAMFPTLVLAPFVLTPFVFARFAEAVFVSTIATRATPIPGVETSIGEPRSHPVGTRIGRQRPVAVKLVAVSVIVSVNPNVSSARARRPVGYHNRSGSYGSRSVITRRAELHPNRKMALRE